MTKEIKRVPISLVIPEDMLIKLDRIATIKFTDRSSVVRQMLDFSMRNDPNFKHATKQVEEVI